MIYSRVCVHILYTRTHSKQLPVHTHTKPDTNAHRAMYTMLRARVCASLMCLSMLVRSSLFYMSTFISTCQCIARPLSSVEELHPEQGLSPAGSSPLQTPCVIDCDA